MSKLITKLTAGAFALAMAMPLSAQEDLSADSVIATVNGTEITLGHVILVRASLPEQYQNLPDDVLWNGIVDQIIQQTVLSQQVEGEESRRIAIALENERRTLTAAQMVESIVTLNVTDATVEEFYQQNFVQGEATEEFNASHILVETEEEAVAIVEELASGADFAAVAQEKSTGPSGPNGGNLGWFGPGAMVPEFQAAVETLEVGAVSAPVQTQFGWHVIILNEKRNQEAPPLEAVRGQIEEQLSQQAVAEEIDRLSADATIIRTETDDFDLSIINDIDLIER